MISALDTLIFGLKLCPKTTHWLYYCLKEELGEAVCLLCIVTLEHKGEYTIVHGYIDFNEKEVECGDLEEEKIARPLDQLMQGHLFLRVVRT